MTGLSSGAVSLVNGDSGQAQSTWVWPDTVGAPARRSLLKSAKLWVLNRAERAGIFRAVRDSEWRNRRLLILAYHGISSADEHQFSPELYLPLEALRARFELMRDGGYTILSLREGVTRLKEGTLPPRAVALTFDDGLHDFLSAVPLLREFGYPATVYVTTYYAQKQVPTFMLACRYLLWVGRTRTISGEALTTDAGTLDLRSAKRRDAALAAIDDHLKSLGGGVEDEMAMLRRLAQRVEVDFDRFLAERRFQIMSPEEIRSLPGELVEVQLHTHRHRVPLREASFQREIEDNRRALAAWRPGEVLDGFCYPSGVVDVRFLPWLRALDVQTGLTCKTGIASAGTDPLLLPRLVDSTGLTRLEFVAWLTGVGSLVPRLPRKSPYRPAPFYD